MEHKNDNQIRDYDKVLDDKYGAPGTPEREQFEVEAEAFCLAECLKEQRRLAGLTQEQLAEKIGTKKSRFSLAVAFKNFQARFFVKLLGNMSIKRFSCRTAMSESMQIVFRKILLNKIAVNNRRSTKSINAVVTDFL